MHENGASGAIFGLYGVMLALMVLKGIPKEINNILMLFSILFIGYNLVMGIFTNSDNAAHIGGLVTGFVIGALLASKLKKNSICSNEGCYITKKNVVLGIQYKNT